MSIHTAAVARHPSRRTAHYAVPSEGVAAPVRETPWRRDRRIALRVSSSPAYPCRAAMPTGSPCALWRFPHGDDIRGNSFESFARYFDAILGTCKYGCLFTEYIARSHLQDEASTTLGAGMLGQQKNARLTSLGGSTIAKPCRQRYARRILRCNAA